MMKAKSFWRAMLVVASVAAMQTAPYAHAQSVSGVTPTEILIGLHTGLSGPAAEHGIGATNGMRMKIDEINAKGGIHGRKIRLIVEDSQYQVPRAVQAANKLINLDKVFLMLQAQGTAMNNAVLPEQLKANIPNMFPSSNARAMSEPVHPLMFAQTTTFYSNSRAGVNWMVANKKKKRICSIYIESDYGRENHEGVADQAKKLGVALVEQATYKPADTDFGSQLIKLKNASCDLVVIGGLVRDSMLIYTTARSMGWTDVDFLGSVGAYDPTLARAPGGGTEGLYASTAILVPDRATASPAAAAWIDTYKSRFNIDPGIAAVQGYVYTDLVIMGLERAGKELTVPKFIEAMEAIKNYQDIFGAPRQSFSAQSHRGSDEAFLVQVRSGKFVNVDRISFQK